MNLQTFQNIVTIWSSEMLFFCSNVSNQHVVSMGMTWKPVSATGLKHLPWDYNSDFFLAIARLYIQNFRIYTCNCEKV